MLDDHSIGRLLLESGRITTDDYAWAGREARAGGRAPYDVLLSAGKITVDELMYAITVHLDIMLLREAVGLGNVPEFPMPPFKRPGSYLERISLLFKTSVLIGAQTNLCALVDVLLKEAPAVMNAERATIFTADFERRELHSHVGVGIRDGEIKISWDSGIAGWVFRQEASLNIPDVYSDPRFNKDVDAATGYRTRSILCVPLRAPGGRTLGVFQALNKRAGVFTPTDCEILEILASQAARCMEKVVQLGDAPLAEEGAARQMQSVREALSGEWPLDAIVGTSRVMQELRSLIRTVAPNDTTVLIQAESGTGKELVARAIHRLSLRAESPMVTLNCAAVPAELIESELFGHKRGSFTGAFADHKGLFRSAHTGTLFLDEIEATSPAMQVKLLRAIQEQEIRPVGETSSHKVDVRIIAATNKDLAAMITQGRFREDLYYRINVFPIVIPPLRDRPEDIPPLAAHFLESLAARSGKRLRGVDPTAMELLMKYDWPGNVRELENEIERAHVLTGEGRNISVGGISRRISECVEGILKRTEEMSRPVKLRDAVYELEKKLVEEALTACRGNRSRAAERLGLSRQGLLNKLGRFAGESSP